MPSREDRLYCSFCRRDDQVVPSLVAGPGVFICGDCVQLATRAIRGQSIPDFPGWTTMPDEALLASLRPAMAVAERVEASVGDLVGLLRERAVAWARIGDALGVSRQAAWARFAGRDVPE